MKSNLISGQILLNFRNPDEQTSGEIELDAMKSYYLEAIMVKHGDSNDHLSVGARFPSGMMARPLPAQYITQTRLSTVSKKHSLPRPSHTETGKIHASHFFITKGNWGAYLISGTLEGGLREKLLSSFRCKFTI